MSLRSHSSETVFPSNNHRTSDSLNMELFCECTLKEVTKNNSTCMVEPVVRGSKRGIWASHEMVDVLAIGLHSSEIVFPRNNHRISNSFFNMELILRVLFERRDEEQ